MGMCLGLTTIGDANLARLFRDPVLVWQLVAPDEAEEHAAEAAEAAPPSFWSRLFGTLRKRPARAVLELSDHEGQTIDLDKAWHGIHYLLTGAADEGEPPANFLLAAGRPVGDIDLGLGPARGLSADETARAAAVLRSRSDAWLRARFDPADMMAKEVYPGIWDRDPRDDDTLGYLMEYVVILRRFLDAAVERRLGLLVYLT